MQVNDHLLWQLTKLTLGGTENPVAPLTLKKDTLAGHRNETQVQLTGQIKISQGPSLPKFLLAKIHLLTVNQIALSVKTYLQQSGVFTKTIHLIISSECTHHTTCTPSDVRYLIRSPKCTFWRFSANMPFGQPGRCFIIC